jgi:uncharacterized membrane protein
MMSALLWFAAIGCGLLGGLYFAFSTFIMTALGRIDPAAGMAAMNAINLVIVRSLFMPLFLGTTLAAAILALLALLRWGQPGMAAALAGGLLHVLGMFAVTMVWNVPLNNALAAAQPDAAGTALWTHYRSAWTAWNHVRTLASTGASVLFTWALLAGR